MIHARDIMSTKITTLHEDAKIIDVIRLLVEHRVTGLPVVSEAGGLMGMVTEKDILKMLLYGSEVKGKTAGDLMTREITSFEEDEDLMKVFETLVESNFRRVPILSDGKLVGIISRRDIIKFLSERARGARANNSQ